MRLIEDWRQWPRFYSTWAFGSIATIQGGAAFLSAEIIVMHVPLAPMHVTWATLISSVTAFLAISGAIGRILAQSPAPAVEKEPEP